MKRLTTIICLLLPSVVFANPPLIIGYVPTKAGGKAVFTSTRGSCDEHSKLAYLVASTGKVATTGCYMLIGDDLMVHWKLINETYSYDFEAMELSSDFREYTSQLDTEPRI
jgi:hypothetical protein